MKKLILLLVICTSSLMLETTFAQVSTRINIGVQPMWGPVGYDYVEYYYLPDIEVYYNVPSHKYIYMEGPRWVSKSYLPQRYKSYNVYNGRKVIMNENKPYLHHHTNMQKYARSNEHSNQQSIRDSHETKYYVNKNHPEHYKYKKSNTQNQKVNKKQKNGHKGN